MKALLLADEEYLSPVYQRLKDEVSRFLKLRGFETQCLEVKAEQVTFCRGCFGCWIKKPGECVLKDAMSEINPAVMNSDTVIYLSPIIFGQFSPTLKSVIDRGLPNMLPFFVKRPDGSTMHPPRYKTYPNLIIIGYGEGIGEEDKQLFRDITLKHRRSVDVLIYEGSSAAFAETLSTIKLGRVKGSL